MFRLTPYRASNMLDAFDQFLDNGLLDSREFPTTYRQRQTFRVDVKDADDSYMIEAELPGVDKKDISIDYKENRLLIRVETKDEKVDKENTEDKYIYRERYQASMERAFYIKDIKANEISASLMNGILTVKAPKLSEIDAVHKIEIQ